MDVEVKRGADVGVSEDDADGFIIAVALDATCGEAVSQSMKFDHWDVELLEQAVVVVAVGSWLSRLFIISQNKERFINNFHKRRKDFVEFIR